MLNLATAYPTAIQSCRYQLEIATSSRAIAEAQRLRFRVFVEELGASTAHIVGDREVDEFDVHCDHLIVREDDTGAVIGCYRIMKPGVAAWRGRFYSDGEFDLSALKPLRGTMAEVGRSCIHPDHRNGTVIMLLWSGLARYLTEHRFSHAIGCASIPLSDGHTNVAAIVRQLMRDHLAPAELRVQPHYPYPLAASDAVTPIVAPRMPPLLKGYTRLGAWIGGEPAWDPDFNTADLFILLPLSRVSQAYAKHFFGREQAA